MSFWPALATVWDCFTAPTKKICDLSEIKWLWSNSVYLDLFNIMKQYNKNFQKFKYYIS